jgi:uncharacterized membrane protein YoaK (UPF0700 family)
MFGWGFMPVGAICGGLLAGWLGLRAPYVVAFVVRGGVSLALMPALLHALSRARQHRPAPRGAADRPA